MPERPEEHTGERLQKVLARVGIGSRRVSEELIDAGRVSVNGEVAVLGRRVDADHDRIEVDGVPVGVRPGLVHYLLNKPDGVVTTASDPEGRTTVVDLVPADPRVHPVGRLDADTEGLLLLTNDGDLTFRLTHPRFGVEKEYLAVVDGAPRPSAVRSLRQGVELDDGMTAPARVAVVAPETLRIVIHEGRNRQVRRMCQAIGHPVRRLVRIRIGPVTDRRLAPGEWRPLTTVELRGLEEAAAAHPDPPATRAERRAAGRATDPADADADVGADAADATDSADPDAGADAATDPADADPDAATDPADADAAIDADADADAGADAGGAM